MSCSIAPTEFDLKIDGEPQGKAIVKGDCVDILINDKVVLSKPINQENSFPSVMAWIERNFLSIWKDNNSLASSVQNALRTFKFAKKDPEEYFLRIWPTAEGHMVVEELEKCPPYSDLRDTKTAVLKIKGEHKVAFDDGDFR